MEFGLCTNMLARNEDRIGQWIIPAAAEAGYDYIELPLTQVMDLSASEFEHLLKIVNDSGIPCRACNNFFPETIKLTGPSADDVRIKDYVDKALERVAKLHAERIVFGSSGARNVPEGFPKEKAWEQLISALGIIDAAVRSAHSIIVVEPLNTLESNIVINGSEGLKLVQETDLPNIQLLLDYYHMAKEHESISIIDEAGPLLQHAHISNPVGRVFPSTGDGQDYHAFFAKLHANAYAGCVSVEGYSEHPEGELPVTLDFLKEIVETSENI